MRSNWCYGLALLVLGAFVAAGCSGRPGGLPDLGEVSGTVTIAGTPTPDLMVQFTPVEGGRMSVGTTDQAGKYSLTYTAEAPGAIVGKHKVTVVAQELGDESSLDMSVGNPIPQDKRNETFDFEVAPGSNTFDIEL